MSRNDDRRIGGDEEGLKGNPATGRDHVTSAGARVTGVHGVGAPGVTDHDIPASAPEVAADRRHGERRQADRRRH